MSKQEILEQIDREIQRLHEAELEEETRAHRSSSVEARYGDAPVNKTYLDTLARLITGSDVCTAVCFDGANLLLSSNKSFEHDGLRFARPYMAALQRFINEPFQPNYEELEALAKHKSEMVRKTVLKQAAKFTLAVAEAESSGNVPSQNFLQLFSGAPIETLYKAARAVSADESAPIEARNLASDILRPLVDTINLTNAIIDGRVDPNVVKAIGAGRVVPIDGEDNVHAEMKIIQHLYDNGQLKDGNSFNIGVTKLACCPCYIALEAIRAQTGASIRVDGTHGGTYEAWVPPNFLLEDDRFLNILKSMRGGEFPKGREIRNIDANDLRIEPPRLFRSNEHLQEIEKELRKTLAPVIKANKRLKDALIQKEQQLRQIEDETARLEQQLHVAERQKKVKSSVADVANRIAAELAQTEKQIGDYSKQLAKIDRKKNSKLFNDTNSTLSSLRSKKKKLDAQIAASAQAPQKQPDVQGQSVDDLREHALELHRQKATLINAYGALKNERESLRKQFAKEISYYNNIQKIRQHLGRLGASASSGKGKGTGYDRAWYRVENIINAFNQSNGGAKIVRFAVDSPETLDGVINGQVIGKPNVRLAVPLNVNTLDGSFTATNHWVGLFIETDGAGRVVRQRYLDPLGGDIDPAIEARVQSLTGVASDNITQGRAIQYAVRVDESESEAAAVEPVIRLRGNDYDCGPFVAYLFSRVANNQPLPSALDNQKSLQFGQQLRQLFDQEVADERDLRHMGHAELRRDKKEHKQAAQDQVGAVDHAHHDSSPSQAADQMGLGSALSQQVAQLGRRLSHNMHVDNSNSSSPAAPPASPRSAAVQQQQHGGDTTQLP